jgi:acyl-CoA synthetase (AMP-forming)/AMP-acid ligase II
MNYQLADLMESVADAVPEREAIVYGNRRLTFRGFDTRATQLANALQARGIGAGDRVGLYLYNCNEYLEGALAAFKLSASPVNINFRYVEEELRYLCDDADLKAMIFHREFAPRVAAIIDKLPLLKTLIVVEDDTAATDLPYVIEYESAIRDQPATRGFPARSGDDVYLLYTGGTTGMPKGVMWRHEDVFFAGLQGGNPGGPDITSPEELAQNAAANSNPTVTLPVAPLMHGNGHWASMIGLHGGGKVVLAQSRRLDPHEIWSLVERERVSVLSIVGDAMARPMADALEEGHVAQPPPAVIDGAQAPPPAQSNIQHPTSNIGDSSVVHPPSSIVAPNTPYDTSSMVALSSAGALFSEDVKDRLREKKAALLIIDAFGMSEAGHQGMNLGKNADGRLHFQIDAFTAVLDEDLRRIEPGSDKVGMLGRTGRLPLGYWKDPAKTAATFVTDPDGRRWVMAGDMATVEPDGTIVVLGRGSLCINSGGEKIYPEEVELALRSHPGVYDAVVVGVPDTRWGSRVAAVVQPQAGASPTLDELSEHCATRIARYKLPRELHLVDAMHRSPSGKADYKWAKEVAMRGAQ